VPRLRTKGWNLLDHRGVLNTIDDRRRHTAGRTDLDVDAEDAFRPLRPSYCHRWHVCRFCRSKNRSSRYGVLSRVAPAHPCARDTCESLHIVADVAIRRERQALFRDRRAVAGVMCPVFLCALRGRSRRRYLFHSSPDISGNSMPGSTTRLIHTVNALRRSSCSGTSRQ